MTCADGLPPGASSTAGVKKKLSGATRHLLRKGESKTQDVGLILNRREIDYSVFYHHSAESLLSPYSISLSLSVCLSLSLLVFLVCLSKRKVMQMKSELTSG